MHNTQFHSAAICGFSKERGREFLMKPELRWVGVFENLQDMPATFWGEKTLDEWA